MNATDGTSSRSAPGRQVSDAAAADPGGPAASEEEWTHTVGMRMFRAGDLPTDPLAIPNLVDTPDPTQMPGYVFQAARQLSGLSQRDLSEAASVSRKGLNDFENGLAPLGPKLVGKLVLALRGRGVRFVEAEGHVGVLACQPRRRFEEGSRSPSRSRKP